MRASDLGPDGRALLVGGPDGPFDAGGRDDRRQTAPRRPFLSERAPHPFVIVRQNRPLHRFGGDPDLLETVCNLPVSVEARLEDLPVVHPRRVGGAGIEEGEVAPPERCIDLLFPLSIPATARATVNRQPGQP